ncbi:hypothetical protein GUJ93_ZPchr0007g3331 [Zizania palustris]|uniref:peptidylprolyl isomerase n=1 Tax=Zizania palustris TaxID=103762 RepID=A0A8J5TDR8_ZIZPA|nr:hypothetical protein GUJ93_ZPchr0007g3331 [Zizania palustris]
MVSSCRWLSHRSRGDWRGGGDAYAVSTSRRALRASKIPESEFTTLPNGLKYYDISVGTGAKAVKGSRVAVHYVAKWKGITFMTSRQGLGVGGGTPYGFDIGNSERGNVLKGLDLGVEGMKAGARANTDSCIDSSDSSIQLDPSHGSNSIREEEEEAMDSFHCMPRKLVQTENPCSTDRLVSSEFARQPTHAEEIMVAQATEISSEVSVNRIQDDRRMIDDVDSLKRMVSSLEERAVSMEAQFHDYCDMKEQESTYQKMQIMCLGMKLEQLESQNQRLEAAAAEIRASAEEFATVRAKFDELQSKFKKIWKKNKQDFDAIAAEGEGTNNENVEVIVERSMRKLSSSRDLLGGLEALRHRWAADMEEMIYLGWITAWLQHDLLVLDSESGAAAIDGDDDDDETPSKHKGEKMVAAVAPSNEVLCKAASSTSSRASSEMRAAAESCLGLAVGCRKGGSWGGIGRPRLLRRLRGWAGGKGSGSRQEGAQDRIHD